MFTYSLLVNFLARIVATTARINLVLGKLRLIKDNNSDEITKSSNLKAELGEKTKLLQESANNLRKLLVKAIGVTFISVIIIFTAIILWFVI